MQNQSTPQVMDLTATLDRLTLLLELGKVIAHLDATGVTRATAAYLKAARS